MKGLAFDIRRYSVHDGPGIRVTIFLKGCPLACRWCHNPEGINPQPEEITRVDKIGEREFFKRETAGHWYTTDEMMEIILRDQIFLDESSGGVTFSGGEPLLQEEFLTEALQQCKRHNLHTAVDTSGYAPEASILKIIKHTDLFLFDLKHAADEVHLKFTGVSNALIISNLKIISSLEIPYWIRIPVIPGFNESDEDMKAIRDLVTSLPGRLAEKICLLPFHKAGLHKNKMLGTGNDTSIFKVPEKQRLNEIKEIFETTGIHIKIGG